MSWDQAGKQADQPPRRPSRNPLRRPPNEAAWAGDGAAGGNGVGAQVVGAAVLAEEVVCSPDKAVKGSAVEAEEMPVIGASIRPAGGAGVDACAGLERARKPLARPPKLLAGVGGTSGPGRVAGTGAGGAVGAVKSLTTSTTGAGWVGAAPALLAVTSGAGEIVDAGELRARNPLERPPKLRGATGAGAGGTGRPLASTVSVLRSAASVWARLARMRACKLSILEETRLFSLARCRSSRACSRARSAMRCISARYCSRSASVTSVSSSWILGASAASFCAESAGRRCALCELCFSDEVSRLLSALSGCAGPRVRVIALPSWVNSMLMGPSSPAGGMRAAMLCRAVSRERSAGEAGIADRTRPAWRCGLTSIRAPSYTPAEASVPDSINLEPRMRLKEDAWLPRVEAIFAFRASTSSVRSAESGNS
eukprot:m.42972 g.42972  ORF g.42972 m.42972 type:complete len:425 (+) comp5752_c0_seq3:143-1417(+)